MSTTKVWEIDGLCKIIGDYLGAWGDDHWHGSDVSCVTLDHIKWFLNHHCRFTTDAICAMANHQHVENALYVISKQQSLFEKEDIELVIDWTCTYKDLCLLQVLDLRKWIPILSRHLSNIIRAFESQLHLFLKLFKQREWPITRAISEMDFLQIAIRLQTTSDILFFADNMSLVDATFDDFVVQTLMIVASWNNDRDALTILTSRFGFVMKQSDDEYSLFFKTLCSYYIACERMHSLRLLLMFYPSNLTITKEKLKYFSGWFQQFFLGLQGPEPRTKKQKFVCKEQRHPNLVISREDKLVSVW